jgi:hypothetical protein
MSSVYYSRRNCILRVEILDRYGYIEEKDVTDAVFTDLEREQFQDQYSTQMVIECFDRLYPNKKIFASIRADQGNQYKQYTLLKRRCLPINYEYKKHCLYPRDQYRLQFYIYNPDKGLLQRVQKFALNFESDASVVQQFYNYITSPQQSYEQYLRNKRACQIHMNKNDDDDKDDDDVQFYIVINVTYLRGATLHPNVIVSNDIDPYIARIYNVGHQQGQRNQQHNQQQEQPEKQTSENVDEFFQPKSNGCLIL